MLKKPYRVRGYSKLMDVEMNCASAEQANEIYEEMMNSSCYHRGNVSDSLTGELYAYFHKEVEDNGIKVTAWSAFE